MDPNPNPHSSHTTFPFIAIAIIGILATTFLLLSYYIFVIKCCFNWRRFIFLSSHEHPLSFYTPHSQNQGLDETTIRSIPVSRFNPAQIQPNLCECAVCLNEFQQDEPLRIIPNCAHMFHIDCIDVWLQRNSNCPICRTTISNSNNTLFTQFPNSVTDSSSDSDFIVIELSEENNEHGSLLTDQELFGSFDLDEKSEPIAKTEKKIKKGKKSWHVLSMGDEFLIDRGIKDEQFLIQPIRRSFSMDSAADWQLNLAIEEIVEQKKRFEIDERGSRNRVYKSFFSFGHGRGSRNSVLSIGLGQ